MKLGHDKIGSQPYCTVTLTIDEHTALEYALRKRLLEIESKIRSLEADLAERPDFDIAKDLRDSFQDEATLYKSILAKAAAFPT
jgi:hypothetical protein